MRSKMRKHAASSSFAERQDEFYGPGYLVARDVRIRACLSRTLFRVLNRVRKDLGGDDDHFYSGHSSLGVHLLDDCDDPTRMVLASSNTLTRRETKPCGFCRFL